MALIYAKISFPFNIFRTNGQFDQLFYLPSYLQDLYQDCYTLFFAHVLPELGPFNCSKKREHVESNALNSWKLNTLKLLMVEFHFNATI